MSEQIFEVKVVNVRNMPIPVAREVEKKAYEKGKDFNYKGYAEVVYVTASKAKISTVEPISGTPATYFKKQDAESQINSKVF